MAICLVMYFAQDRLTFAPEIAAMHAPETFPTTRFSDVTVTTEDGVTLKGVRSTPTREDAPNIVFFGGNAQNLQKFALFLDRTFPQANLVGVNYRGYGNSEGTPTKKHLMMDIHPVAGWVRANMPNTPTYALGLSIGTGPATKYATLAGAAGLLLVMPYDNLAMVGADAYPWLPVKLMFENNIRTTGFMEKYSNPVGIIVAGDDGLIHPERSKTLARYAQNLISLEIIPGKTHSSMIYSPELRGWLQETFKEMQHITRP